MVGRLGADIGDDAREDGHVVRQRTAALPIDVTRQPFATSSRRIGVGSGAYMRVGEMGEKQRHDLLDDAGAADASSFGR